LRAVHERGLIAACHDISDGGLLTALAEMAFANIELGGAVVGVRLTDTCLWSGFTSHESDYFGEYGGFVIEALDNPAVGELAAEFDVALRRIGATTNDPSIVTADAGGTRHDLAELYEAWASPLRGFYEDVV
jgi:phosphoribosylformylglycinamidine synthase